MKDYITIGIALLIALLVIFSVWMYRKDRDQVAEKEGYPTYTYVNTPQTYGVYPTDPGGWWGGNYYYRLNWFPWGYHRPGYYYRRPGFYGGRFRRYGRYPYGRYPRYGSHEWLKNPELADVPGEAPIPVGDPVPLDTIRGLGGPMLASYKFPKDYAIGQWVSAGIAYTDNPDDDTIVTVQQLNLDPGRDLFAYQIKTKDGQIVPLNLQRRDRLEDGDRFKIPGMEGKGDFVFSEANKYAYVYV